MNFRIRNIHCQDHNSIIEVAKALHPSWLNDEGIQEIAEALRTEQGWVALDDEKAIGFLICSTD